MLMDELLDRLRAMPETARVCIADGRGDFEILSVDYESPEVVICVERVATHQTPGGDVTNNVVPFPSPDGRVH